MKKTLSAIAVLALLSTSAIAAETNPTETTNTAQPKEKKLCRKVAVTGTILGGKKVCRTRADWAAVDQANGENATRARDSMSSGALPRSE